METPAQLSAVRIAATVIAVGFEVLFPLVIAWFAWRRLRVAWRYFAYGAIIFLLFQLISRVPLVMALQGIVAPQLQASRVWLLSWIAGLSLSAGLAEEIGRYMGYRWLFREEKTWARAVMYGLGHGGLESMVLVAGLTLLGLINLVALSTMDISALPLTAEQRDQIRQQLAAVAAQPDWLPLVGAWERLWTLPVHVALSVMVLQVFRRGQVWWLWLAVAAHTLVNLVAVGMGPVFGLQGMDAIWAPEIVVTIAGLAGLWVIWRLRDAPAPQNDGTPGA